MAKQPLDLYKLFTLVVERGGLVEVSPDCYSSIWSVLSAFLHVITLPVPIHSVLLT